MRYTAPVEEMKTVLSALGYERLLGSRRFPDLGEETVGAVLSEAGKLAEEVLAPLNRVGDTHPAHLESGVVRTSPGFAAAYRAISEGGWVGVSASSAHGGLALPVSLLACVNEMLGSGCLALQLCVLLSQGQIEALERHADARMKQLFLPKLISGEWTGTMNLSEPQAGSDVGALRTRAEPAGDGLYRITGQKIYITWGDHDIADNVCHLVLARLPDAPAGTRGISLFLVPKRLPAAGGVPGVANALRVVSLEHKMGLNGSPTAVMQYDGATGWLVGEEQGGMAAMFTMMNNARLGVGVQGVSIAEAALQAARRFAAERRQGRTPSADGSIAGHPDVRRNLMTMAALTRTARALCLDCALAGDLAAATGDDRWTAKAALLTPVAKAYATDVGCEVAECGIQVHGGMGYIEETGVAQFYRDVRVTTIYEGTNGIQAADLVGRKMADGGAALRDLFEEVENTAGESGQLGRQLAGALAELRDTTDWMLGAAMTDRLAGSAPYLRALALVLGGHYLIRVAGSDPARLGLARFHVEQVMPAANWLLSASRRGVQALEALDPVA